MAGSALAQTTVYVDGSVATTGTGSQAAPFKTITEALALTDVDLTILVAGGTYTNETPYTDILSDQTLIGGYDSSFTISDTLSTPTIIDMGRLSQLDQQGTFFIGGATGWTIENLVIQNSTTGEYDDTENGGAIYVRNGSNGTFRDVTFFNCHTKFEGGVESGPAREGGAVCIRDDSTVVFEDCVFDSCTAVGGGGAVRMRSARGAGNTAKFYRCLFTNCGARGNGSVIDDGDGASQIEIMNCIFANNGVDVVVPSGTAPSTYLIRVSDRRALIYNCTFVGNNNPTGYMFNIGNSSSGGAVKEIVNCIITDSTIGSGGSGVAIFNYADDYDDATILQNNLFFNNSDLDPLDPTGANIINTNGNIAGDPQFVNAANGDYYLKPGSPGEDAGQTLALVFDDFAHTLRPVGSAYDIGALEGQRMNPKVRSVMAKASSSIMADLGPENTVDESGLNPWGQHDTTPTNMWLSRFGQEPPVWIQYEFDIAYNLDQMWIWNSNTELEPIVGLGGLGVKTATIEYSTDGTTWTVLADVPEFAQAPGTDDYTYDTTVYFDGVAAKFVKITCTSSWGGGGQYGLSEVRFFYFPVQARYPNPGDGATGVAIDTTLSWLAGTEAAEHKVYFSEDEQSVIDGTATAVTVSEASYDPLSLDLGSMYYWRVDEVNNTNPESPWVGSVWSFTTADYAIVDDFEDYKGELAPLEERIWFSWHDGFGYGGPATPPYYPGNGTGSGVGDLDNPVTYMEESTVHGGNMSMPYFFNNSGSTGKAYYSEAKKTLVDRRDWTEGGVKALSLWFQGYSASVGSFTDNLDGTYTMTASGTDITGTSDEFHFAYKPLNGAGSIVARIDSMDNTNEWAKAGVMIRDTLDPNSAHAMVFVTPGNGVVFEYRPGAGQDNVGSAAVQSGITAPHWVKLDRDIVGNITTSQSADGLTWDILGTEQNIPMNIPIYIGLAVTAHNENATCQAEFSNFQLAVSGPWANQDIGIESNEAERMYVSIANSNGTTGTVYYDDNDNIVEDATQIDTWTEFNIDLKDFQDQGVNMVDVNSVTVGIGTKGSTTPGGAGKVYIDDIRLYRPRCLPDKVTLSEADFDSNCIVDFRDLETLAGEWLANDSGLSVDLNTDSTVDFKDYAILANQWLEQQLWPTW
jgi:hypothetical protein